MGTAMKLDHFLCPTCGHDFSSATWTISTPPAPGQVTVRIVGGTPLLTQSA